jgi:hypothetical protein
MAIVSFNDLVQALSIVVSNAQDMLDQHYVDQFNVNLQDENKQLRTMSIPFPQTNGAYTNREIPQVAFKHHNSLVLDEARIKMNVYAEWNEQKKDLDIDFSVPVKQNQDEAEKKDTDEPAKCHEIELVFKRGEAAEGIARVRNEHTKVI